MKRGLGLTLILLVLISINFITAVEISLSKQSYNPRETLDYNDRERGSSMTYQVVLKLY